MSRTVDFKKLEKLIEQIGENGKAKLVVESKLSFSTIDKLCRGAYPSTLKESYRDSLCVALGKLLKRKVYENELFPLATTRGRAS